MPGNANSRSGEVNTIQEPIARILKRPRLLDPLKGSVYADSHDTLYFRDAKKYLTACEAISGIAYLLDNFSSITLTDASKFLCAYYDRNDIRVELVQEINTDDYIELSDTHDKFWVFWYTVNKK